MTLDEKEESLRQQSHDWFLSYKNYKIPTTFWVTFTQKRRILNVKL